MKSIIYRLTEKITLLKNSKKIDETTVNRFDTLLKARASIRAINPDMFEVIILKPPAKIPSLSSQLCLQLLRWCLLTSLGGRGFLDTFAKSYGSFSHEDAHILL